MMNRAYSILNVKTIDSERRILIGMATTPTPDRLGDVIEPMGVRFADELPLLWQHDTKKPVGRVRFGKPSKDGIAFEAHIPQAPIEESGDLKDRINEAWQSVKMGLVRAVSIGFKSIKHEFMKDSDGIRFTDSEVLELSLVTIPANQDCTISHIRSIDAPLLAASGIAIEDIDRPKRPGVTGLIRSNKPGVAGAVRFNKPDAPKDARTVTVKKTIAEQIASFENTRAAKVARMEELMGKAADDGATLDTAESEEYDTNEQDVKKVDEHLVRLRKFEQQNKEAAKPIAEIEKQNTGTAMTLNGQGRVISVRPNIEKGTVFTRLACCLALGRGNRWEALNHAKSAYWHDQTPEVAMLLENDVAMLLRTPVAEGTTFGATYAAPLVVAQNMASEFAEVLRPATIIGRINGLRRVPFNISLPRATAGTSVSWVGESAPKPVTSMSFDTITMRWSKAAAIIVLTEELVRFSNPSAEALVRADLINAMAQFLDRQFIDPAVAAVTNVSPASITNGVTPIVPTGTTASAFRADIKTLFGTFLAANLQTTSGFWIMTQSQALALSIMQNSLGQEVFPSLNRTGDGTLLGFPVIASENIPSSTGSPTEGFPIIFGIASEIMLADDGQVSIDASNQASIQMETAPDSPPLASSNMMSLWQLNQVGIKAERFITWLKRRSTAVAFIGSAKYSE